MGCVYAAHRELVRTMGDAAPLYADCERLWRRSPHRTVPVDWHALAAWIEEHLDDPTQLALEL